MQQKIKDLVLRAQKDRKVTVIAIAICAALIFMVFSTSNSGQQRRTNVTDNSAGKKSQEQPIAIAQREAYNDLQRRFQSDLEDIKSESKAIRQENADLKKGQQDIEERTAEIFKRILSKMADNPGGNGQAPAGAPRPVDLGDGGQMPQPVDTGAGLEDASLSTQELESFGLEQKQVAPPAPPAAEKVAFVGAGDSVRVKLLAGVNAPTDGTPYPVVFKLMSDVHGPDGSTLPLGEARLIAAAQGSLTDSRALFRLSSINIRLPDGRRKVLKADGWIVGEDGIRGMPGVLIDPIGKAIGGAGFAAGISAAGEGIAAANTTIYRNSLTGTTEQFVSGSLGQYAAGKGLSGASREWSGIIRDRLDDMVPVVQVLSGREGTAVFAKNLTVTGLYEALEDEDSSAATTD